MVDVVRGAIPDDIERCIELWVEALLDRDGSVDPLPVADRMRRLFDGPITRFALAGDPVDGFAVTAPKPGDPAVTVLERIAVRPASAGQGVGRLLLEDAIRSARSAGFTTMELAVRTGNGAVRLYEKAGFRSASDPVPHPLGGEPMVTYRLEL